MENLAEYRKHQGEPGYENITRLFLVIDEFHEMSQFVSTEMEYKRHALKMMVCRRVDLPLFVPPETKPWTLPSPPNYHTAVSGY